MQISILEQKFFCERVHQILAEKYLESFFRSRQSRKKNYVKTINHPDLHYTNSPPPPPPPLPLLKGVKLSDVYEAGVAIVKKEHPELENSLVKSFGFGMGIEFREASLLIAPKTKAPAKKGKCELFS